MKPTKNRIFCYNCLRVKMLFPTQEKADNFIRFNAENIAETSRIVPVRSYFCPACAGWHVTHREEPGEYARTDEQNEKAFRLGVFLSGLKRDFDKKEWKKWKESLELHKQWMEELKDLPEHRLFLLEAKRQFNHFDKLVAAGEKEEQKHRNKQFNEINAERKKLCVDIREKMKDLNVKGCTASAERLRQLMGMPAFALSDKNIIQECRDMTGCLLDVEKREKLDNILNTLQYLNGRMNYTPTGDLEKMIKTMTDNMAVVTFGLKKKKILHSLQNRLNKCVKYLQSRTGQSTGGECVDKVLQTLETHYETIRLYLIEAVNSLQTGEGDKALEYLTMVDNRLKAVPMSARKIEMMKFLTAVAEKSGMA